MKIKVKQIGLILVGMFILCSIFIQGASTNFPIDPNCSGNCPVSLQPPAIPPATASISGVAIALSFSDNSNPGLNTVKPIINKNNSETKINITTIKKDTEINNSSKEIKNDTKIPKENYSNLITGNVIGTQKETFFSKILNFFKKIFGGKNGN